MSGYKEKISEEIILLHYRIKKAVVILTENKPGKTFTVHLIFKEVADQCILVKTPGVYREITLIMRHLKQDQFITEGRGKAQSRFYILAKPLPIP